MIFVEKSDDLNHSVYILDTLLHTHTIFMAIFPGEPGLAGCPLNSHSLFILRLCSIVL